MPQELIFYPGFALMFLTLLVLGLMAVRRIVGLNRGDINPKYFKLNQGYDVPDSVVAVAKNFQNLSELPIIFYALLFSIYLLGRVDTFYLGLCWGFVGLRYLHSYFHIFGNPVRLRFFVFAMGYFVLIAIFVRLLMQVVL